MKSINSTQARNRFGEILEEVYHRKEPVIIERRGHPLVAILPLSSETKTQKTYGPLSLATFHGGKTESTFSRKEIYGEQGR